MKMRLSTEGVNYTVSLHMTIIHITGMRCAVEMVMRKHSLRHIFKDLIDSSF